MIADSEDEDKRLDVFLAENLEKYSRSFLQKLVKDERVLVNGKDRKNRYLLIEGDEVEVQVPEAKPLDLEGENLSLEIIYEDDDVIVVNKPKGMVVHPGSGNWEGTLVNGLLYHCRGNLSSINGVIRPGIVHRIDKDTTGLIMVAKNDEAHRSLQNQLKERTVSRKYHVLTHGIVKENQLEIEAPIGRSPRHPLKMAVVDDGRYAKTHFRVLERYKTATYGEARLETGRTHQIRVHLQYIGYPLVGDPLYAPKKAAFHSKGQMLHAKTLGFIHPKSGENLEFDSPLPEDFLRVKKILEEGSFEKNS